MNLEYCFERKFIITILLRSESSFRHAWQCSPEEIVIIQTQDEGVEVDVYLQRMGAPDTSSRAQVVAARPWATLTDMCNRQSDGEHGLLSGPIEALNRAARDHCWSFSDPGPRPRDAEVAAPLFVVADAVGGIVALKSVFAAMRRPVFALHLPEVCSFSDLRFTRCV